MRRLNVGCGPFRAASPWVNTDVVVNDGIRPDIVVDDHMPFADDTFGRVYCGHVLEHMPGVDVESFLHELARVGRSGGLLLVVGPDVLKTIEQWRMGHVSWSQILDYVESDVSHQEVEGPAARHQWNCDGERLERVMRSVLTDVRPLEIAEDVLRGWPVISHARHQCAVLGTFM